MSPEGTTAAAVSRWRVVIVRLPAEGARRLAGVLPKGRALRRQDLPIAVEITTDGSRARATAERLRSLGAEVVLVEEAAGPRTAFCASHPALMASLDCESCGTAICNRCMLEAEGLALCDRCRRRVQTVKKNTRTRQLFVVFLFTVFLYQVGLFLRADRELVSALGPVSMVFVQFVDDPDPNPWIARALNGEPVRGYVGPGLRELAQWFDAEHRRYTSSEHAYAQVTVRGPWRETVAPPDLDDPEAPWWRMTFESIRFPRYFRGLALDHGVDTRAFGVRAYIVYVSGESDVAAHSRGSAKGRLAVAYIDLEEKNAAYALAAVAHEICHALGAQDLYDPSSYLPQHPEGFVEPFREPLYPQRYAEIMAVDLPIGHGLETEVHSLDQLRVGHRTAADMGWISREQADRFYTPPEVLPEQLLEPDALLP